jgi:acyl carrier protein
LAGALTATRETEMKITESELLDMLSEEAIVDRDRLTRDARLEDLGISSIDVISLLFELEERTGVRVDEGDMPQMETLGDMVDHLLSKINLAGDQA